MSVSRHSLFLPKSGPMSPRRMVAGLAMTLACIALVAPAPAPAALDDGPGGPILVVKGAADEFGGYYAEILRNEGLNAFDVADLAAVTPSMLAAHDVVILGETSLSPAEVSMLTDWVDDGGNLIAMRPDPQLAGLLGLSPQAGPVAYTPPAAGAHCLSGF